MDPAGVCPECGLAVEASTKPRDRLQDCPPGWVRKIAAGVGVLALSYVLFAPVMIALAAGALPFGMGYEIRQLLASPQVFGPLAATGWAFAIVTGAGLLVQLPAVWLVTGPEPGGEHPRRRWTRAWRVLAVTALVPILIASYSWMGRAAWPVGPRRSWSVDAGIWASSLAGLAGSLCPAIGLWHVKRLTERIGRPKLAEYAGIVGCALTTLLFLTAAHDFDRSIDELLYFHPELAYWWPTAHATLLALVGPPLVVPLAFRINRLRGGRPRPAAYAWVIALYLLATCWGIYLSDTGYTRKLWKTVLVAGVPIAAWLTFYPWAILVLVRTSWKLFGAANQASEAWRRADASLQPTPAADGGING